MKDWYGTDESFDTVKEVAIQNMLDVFVFEWDIVVPNTCFYSCSTYEELQEKVSSLEGCVTVKWDD
jgi:hypothetical protein|nr:MAG TPA_asm: hypothetical protein [Caudoviricetes sp.]